MTNLERMKLRTGEADESVLLDCLESAKAAILGRRFPYAPWPTQDVEVYMPPTTSIHPETGDEVTLTPGYTKTVKETVLEDRYLDLQYRIALSIYLKRGGDYELSHTENGVSRSWSSEGVPEELLREIVPMVAVIS